MTVPGKIPPIPTPLAQRLRHAKMTFLPGLVFAASVMVIAILWRDRIMPSPLAGSTGDAIADVNSPSDGDRVGLRGERFQTVNTGAPVADVRRSDLKWVD